MDFTTPSYYGIFLPVILLIAFNLKRKSLRSETISLLVFSYIFFWYSSGWYVLLLLISTLTDWIVVRRMLTAGIEEISRKKWLWFSITVNLGFLVVFKYLDMIIEWFNLVSLQVDGPELPLQHLFLPVGISFYTFQSMSYSIDVYRTNEKTFDTFIQFACYVSFFPQLVAGPIVRAKHFHSELTKERSFTVANLKIGLAFIVFGLFKKLVIADNLGLHVDEIFSSAKAVENSITVLYGSLCFGIQIYCDFSAYTDIAIGSAILFGIRLPENFNHPYLSASPQEFWRRWHITLSTWLRDYVYISFGGNRKGVRRMYLALFATMALGGIWHGASFNFLLWGIVHGIILILHRILSRTRQNMQFKERFTKAHFLISWFVTQYLVFLTWLIFRVQDTALLFSSMKSFLLFGDFGIMDTYRSLPDVKFLTFLFILMFIAAHFLGSKYGCLRTRLSEQKLLPYSIILGFMFTAIFILRPAEISTFIYFQF